MMLSVSCWLLSAAVLAGVVLALLHLRRNLAGAAPTLGRGDWRMA